EVRRALRLLARPRPPHQLEHDGADGGVALAGVEGAAVGPRLGVDRAEVGVADEGAVGVDGDAEGAHRSFELERPSPIVRVLRAGPHPYARGATGLRLRGAVARDGGAPAARLAGDGVGLGLAGGPPY